MHTPPACAMAGLEDKSSCNSDSLRQMSFKHQDQAFSVSSTSTRVCKALSPAIEALDTHNDFDVAAESPSAIAAAPFAPIWQPRRESM